MKKVLCFIMLVTLLVPSFLYGETDIDPEEFCLDQPGIENKHDLNICMEKQWAASEEFDTKYLTPYEKILNKLPTDIKMKNAPPEIQALFICMMSTKQIDKNWPYDFVDLMECMDLAIEKINNSRI
jgi:hypothetical protein